MKIALSVGHSRLANGNYTSANGIKNEYLTMKKLAPYIKKFLEQEGHKVDIIICPELKFKEAKEEKDYKLNIINNNKYDLLIELHMNAFNNKAKGTEVLYYSQKGADIAKRVENKLSTVFSGRGIKKRTDLYILRDSFCTAILIEVCFCDNESDCKTYDEMGEIKIARLIAEGIIDKTISNQVLSEKIEENKEDIIYQVVVGSFKERKNADNLIKELREKGYPAFINIIK